MFASVRRYLLEPALVDALGARASEVATLLAGLPGCLGGHLIRTRDGLIVVLFGDDEQAAAYVGTRFVGWAHRRVPGLRGALPPEVWAGEVLRPAGPSDAEASSRGEGADPRGPCHGLRTGYSDGRGLKGADG